jgi:hypothetical protein
MQQATINARLIQVAAGKRTHTHYTRTVELARMYSALSTGEGIEDYMKLYARREDKALFKQRVEITEQITPSIIANLSAILEKAYRSHYRRELTYGAGEQADARAAELETMLAMYAGKMGADRFCQERLIELNCTDPNTWIIQEWKDFDNLRDYASPYPFEVKSDMALDFAYERGELQYLTALTYAANPKDERTPLKVLTCYQKDFASVLRQTPNTTARKDVSELIPGEEIAIDGHLWTYTEYRHNLGFVPAHRAGYKRDKRTNGETYVWPFEAADPYLKKTLKTVSELDLTAANVAMPLTIRYGDICQAPGCNDGYTDGGGTCKSCHGTGRKSSPTSVMEEIVVTPMPDSPDRMLDLSRLYTHVHPDVSILDWQKAYVQDLEKKCKSAVLNSELFSKDEVAQTATGKSIDQQNANDFVYKYFRFYAEFWRFTVETFAEITGKRSGLTAQIFVSRDLKLKTVGELMEDLKSANDSGAGPATRQNIEWDINRAMMVDSPEEFKQWEIRERFNPFSGYTEEQKMAWAQSDLIPRAQRVLYANLGYIFDSLEFENQGFYRLPYEQQRQLVAAKVAEIMEQTGPAAPALAL